jgi:fumarate hydratase subunit alpha
MREIQANDIKEAVAGLVVSTNIHLSPDIKLALEEAKRNEENERAKGVLALILENADAAERLNLPICQDTGMAVVFVEIGQDAHVAGGYIEDAIQEGVREGYLKGFLRKSVVGDPIVRVNTGDNTPAVIHARMVPGDGLRLICAPKGFGSENMSSVKMLKPSDGIEGVKGFVLSVVESADANPCPPIVVGVGVGGTMEKAALLSKQALLRKAGEANPNKLWADAEADLLKKINALGIGPAGLGGKTTALSVAIEAYATHIAGLPVAVNIGCHVTRHAEVLL